MNQAHEIDNNLTRNSSLSLQEFCDMDQLYRLLDNWSKSSGMATVLVDTEGNQISEDFGLTEFCTLVQSCENGKVCCRSTWKADFDGVYECPFGFWDFSIPVVLPDGQILGKVLAGQAMSVRQDDEAIVQKTKKLGIEESLIRDVLSRVQRKSDKEMQGAYELLKETLHFFIQNSYSIWKAKNELKKEPAKKDRILSQITQIMYSYNLTVDLKTETYTLIIGTGMERTVAEYQKHNDYKELKAFQDSILHPAYMNRFNELMDFETARNITSENRFMGTLEYPVLYPGDSEYEWHEINVFIDTEEDGTRVANILGRDITEAHNAQEKNEKELRAAAAKNQILSELTKMLYSYNLTLNLRTGKYSMIIGNGMTQFMEIFKSTDDYETAYNRKISYLDPEYVSQFAALASLQSLRARTHANGFIGNLEYGAITDFGEEWHEINVFISTDEAGEPIANILGRDISEAHKRQEQRENQQKATMARDQLLSGVTKMLYSYNLTVNLETWKYSLITGTGINGVLETMKCSDDYVLLYAKLSQSIAPEDGEELDKLIGIHALRSRINVTGYVGTHSCRFIMNNTNEWHEVNLFMGTNEDGVPVANILGRDITEAHEQQEIKERELRASTARDQLLSGVTKLLYSYNMTVNVNNGTYTLITGTGLTDVVEVMKTTDCFEDIYQEFLKDVDSEYRQRSIELLNLENYRGQKDKTGHLGTEAFPMHRNGTLEWHEINVFAGYDEDGEAIINILGRDVTEAHEKADTKAQLEIANASSAAKTAFLFNMSHDIRTPMNAIVGYAELMKKEINNPKKLMDYQKKIQMSSEFLLSLLNSVLDMARIESGKEQLDESFYNKTGNIAAEVVRVFEMQAKEKNITLKCEVDVEHEYIMCDVVKIREVLTNLVSNAIKYTPAGGTVLVSTEELPSGREGYALYRTVIEDNGIGISKEFLPHLFESFTRERNTTQGKIAGTGLGMAIVKALVELMEGTIEVESELGAGTKFILTIPHKIAQADYCDLSVNKKEVDKSAFCNKRILLAEDNDLNAEIAMEILKDASFIVERAEDGIVCVDMLQKSEQNYYDLILMDIQMPNMDGYKATQIIRCMENSYRRNIPVIAMTANAFEEDKKMALDAGMNGHLAKPIKIDELMSALTEVLLS